MIIAVDLDEVLGSFVDAYLRFYNERHQTLWRREEFHSYNFWEVTGGTREEQQVLFMEFAKTQYFLEMPPFEEAIAAMRALNEHHTLILITSRPPLIERQTHEWLAKHYPGIFKRVHITNQFAKEGFWRSKADVCVEEGADIIIEDHLEYASECAQAGVRALLIDAPWNQTPTLPAGVERVCSWQEIIELLVNRTSP